MVMTHVDLIEKLLRYVGEKFPQCPFPDWILIAHSYNSAEKERSKAQV
jgi:hypothetical protein